MKKTEDPSYITDISDQDRAKIAITDLGLTFPLLKSPGAIVKPVGLGDIRILLRVDKGMRTSATHHTFASRVLG